MPDSLLDSRRSISSHVTFGYHLAFLAYVHDNFIAFTLAYPDRCV